MTCWTSRRTLPLGILVGAIVCVRFGEANDGEQIGHHVPLAGQLKAPDHHGDARHEENGERSQRSIHPE